MIRLIFSDLRDNAMTWVGAFFVAVACGYIGGWAASLQTTASFCAGDLFLYKNLQSTVSLVISFSSIAGVAVLMSAANLTVLAQRRSYALWQLSNVRPLLVSAVVLAQLVVVAVLGALCGTLLAAVTFVPLFPLVFSARSALAQVKPHVGVSLMPNVWLVVAAVFLCGGARGARSAGKTPPLVVLREPEPQHQGMTWFRAFLFAGLAVCTYWLATFMVESGPSVALNCSLYVPILVVATLVPVAPAIFSALLAAWMSLVPKRWNAWYLARHTARYSLSASTSVETPIMVGFGLVAGLFSAVMCWVDYASRQGVTDLNTLDSTTTLLMLGGPVLLCAIGAAVSVVMSSKSRSRDVALLTVAGVGPKTLLAAAVCEAFIHAVTGTMVGVVSVIISNSIIAYAVGLPFPFADVVLGEGLVVSLVGFALVLVATLAPTYSALKQEAAAVLAVRE